MTDAPQTILLCTCSHTEAVCAETRRRLLQALSASDRTWHAVGDLCALSAAMHPRLSEFAKTPNLVVIACNPRAVRCLFSVAGSPLAEEVTLLDMRTHSVDEILNALGLSAEPAREETA